AGYWRRQVRQPVQWAQAMAAMERQQAAIYLEVGPGTTLVGLGRQCVEQAERVWVASLRSARGEWEQILDSLGRIYLRGAEIDWNAFDQPYHRRRTPLPTYPFQRKHFWIQNVEHRLPKSPASEPPANWFYELGWEAKPVLSSTGPSTNSDAADFSSLKTTAERLRIETGFDQYDKLKPSLDRVSADFIIGALRRLGFGFVPKTEFRCEDLARTLGVVPQQFRLFERLLTVFTEEGIVARDDARWVVVRNPPEGDPAAECRTLESKFAPFRAEIEMLRRCGSALAEVLSGRTDPLQLLFSEGSFESAEALYTESPGLRVFNSLAAAAVAQEVRQRPGRKLRILEIGAGTGATTAWIAEVLPPERTEYCYTDISAAFLTRAKNKFKDHPFFQYRTLDIERDPGAQGFQPGQFDIIIAANVLHATTDLASTMRHARSLLAPSGVVLLVEGIRPEAWVDLTFGLTEGWWRFRDHELRPSYPLISQEKWVDLLTATGFCGADAIRAGDSQVAIILARAPHTAIAHHWLVIPDRGGVAAEFTSLLHSLGGSFDMANAEQALDLLQTQRFEGVLYLPVLDCPPTAALSAESIRAQIFDGNDTILRLVQTLIKTSGRLWTVTRGAQQVVGTEAELNVAQATAWGWSKTISLEHPNCGGGVIDLDPAASDRENASVILDAVLNIGTNAEDQIAIRNGMRYVPRLRRSPPPPCALQPLAKDKTYLITGGLGGVGLGLARWMAQRGARRLFLVGRTALPDRATWDKVPSDSDAGARITAIREIESFGTEVSLGIVDLFDQQQVETMFASVSGELGGIFHLAAAGDASSLVNMTSDGMRKVMAPKMLGTWNLHVASRNMALDFFVMFSSWASVLGAQDLGHYNAANQFMDAVAHYRRSLGLPATALNWGAWDVIRNASAELLREYERSGLQSMPSAAAFTAMYRAASAGTTQMLVANVDWQKLKPLYEIRRARPILEFTSNLAQPSAAQVSPVADGSANQAIAERPAESKESPRVNIRAEILRSSTGERIHRLESYVAGVLAAVIGTPGGQLAYSTATDELGLDSLMALEARNQINSELEINIPVARFLQGLTITELAAKIAAELSDDILAIEPQTAPDPSLNIDDSFGLSFAQRAYWVVQRVVPDSITSNCAFTAKASPFLQFDAFERAVWKLMERHAALRTVIFETEDGEPRQCVQTSWRPETTLIDVSGLTEREFADLVEREFTRSFDMTKSVFRIPVFRRNDYDVLLFVFHHVVVDGTSMPLSFGELRDMYTAELTGQSVQLAPVRATFKDFVDWESKLVNGPGMQRLWDFWEQELDGELPILTLPFSRPRSASFLPRGVRMTLEFDSELTHAIHESARQTKATTFVFLLAAFQILLSSYSGQDDLLVGTSSSTRDLAKWENTVGCLVNLFPIRSRSSRTATFAEYLTATRRTILAALDHQGVPFYLLIERLRVRRELGRPTLFQAFFNFLTERPGDLGRFLLGVPDATVQFGNSVLTSWMNLRYPETQSDIMLYLADFGEEIHGYFHYNADVIDESVIRSMTTDYIAIVRAIVANPNIPISQLPITSFPQSETEPEELLL
ncbi:MAG TPA: condensation domain-containing protein, partial [Terracidiphilus sp.]